MSPLVSVVIPTYNHARFLGRALQSVLDQSYSNWEALVIDNHSQDNTDEVVAGLVDPRIRLLKIHNHGVIAASRNLGMQQASGEWIAFLDSDDCWYPRKLELAVAALEADAADVFSNDELRVDIRTGAKRILRYGPYEPDFYRTLLVEGNRLSPSATLVRREFLLRHGLQFEERQDFATVEDYGLWLNLARSGARFKFIRDVQGEFVIHGANSSGQMSRHLKNTETLLHHHVFSLQQFDSAPDELWKLVSFRLRVARVRQSLAAGQLGGALRLAFQLVADYPLGAASYLCLKLRRRT